MFDRIKPNGHDETLALPGDDMIARPDVVITSAFNLSAPPSQVFPWFVQLGKQRAGWYFTKTAEKFFFPSARGIWHIEPKWQNLKVGDRIPDYGKDGYFDCFYLEQDKAIGYTSTRGKVTMTWVLSFGPSDNGTHVVIRLRAAGFRRKGRLLMAAGKFIDHMTISWLAAGMKARVGH